MDELYDVMIIGGGVVGSAIARELSRYELKIGVLEKNLDVCFETSGRNSGVIHGGFAYDPGTYKARFCVEGNLEFDQVAAELGVPFKRTGKVLVGNKPADMESLKRTLESGQINGSCGLEIIDDAQLHNLVPSVIGKFALMSPNSGNVDPFLYTIALAENAACNGVTYLFDHEVTGISRARDRYTIITSKGDYHTRWIVNSAGLGCGKISEMLGLRGYKIVGSKGDYIILDKNVGHLLPMPVYPVPSNTYMGIHVTPTVDGNVIVGPNAEYINEDAFSYYGVSQKEIRSLAESANTLWPCIHKKDYIRNYCGILPKWVDENGKIQDYKIEARSEAPNSVNLVGIESPALTSALPIARYVVSLIAEKESFIRNTTFSPVRKPIIRFAEQNDESKERLIKENPDYGEIICRCEIVTKAEMLQAIHNPLNVDTVASIKYRTRAMMGRCQGGYCQTRLAEMIEQEKSKAVEDIVYARNGSNLFVGKVRR